jgi:hypothetical protein
LLLISFYFVRAPYPRPKRTLFHQSLSWWAFPRHSATHLVKRIAPLSQLPFASEYDRNGDFPKSRFELSVFVVAPEKPFFGLIVLPAGNVHLDSHWLAISVLCSRAASRPNSDGSIDR